MEQSKIIDTLETYHSPSRELSKFGFFPSEEVAITHESSPDGSSPAPKLPEHVVPGPDVGQSIITGNYQPSMSSGIIFGRFQPCIIVGSNDVNYRFEGCRYKEKVWSNIPNFMLFHIMDQRHFGYSDSHIATI